MRKKIALIILLIVFILTLILINNMLKHRIENEKSGEINNTNLEEKDMGILNKNDENVIDVTTDNFEDKVLKNDKPVLIDFYATWCGPCMLLSPRVEQIAQERDDFVLAKIDVDAEQDLAIKYNIMSIPTLVLIKNGQEVERSVGLIDREEILAMLNK